MRIAVTGLEYWRLHPTRKLFQGGTTETATSGGWCVLKVLEIRQRFLSIPLTNDDPWLSKMTAFELAEV